MIYLGIPGRMIGLKCPASQQLSHAERFTFSVTAEGRRKAQVLPPGRREWSLQTSDATTARDQSTLMAFANGDWGPGPFRFVSSDAPYTNLLPPAVASCSADENQSTVILSLGPWETSEGWAPKHYLNPGNVTSTFFGTDTTGHVPVLPGIQVTGSVVVEGAGALARLVFYDAAGAQLTFADSTITATTSTSVRSWVSAMPPAGAVTARIFARTASRSAFPAITWSDNLLDWADGQGCLKAVLHGASRGLTLTGPNRTYSNLSYTVTEVD